MSKRNFKLKIELSDSDIRILGEILPCGAALLEAGGAPESDIQLCDSLLLEFQTAIIHHTSFSPNSFAYTTAVLWAANEAVAGRLSVDEDILEVLRPHLFSLNRLSSQFEQEHQRLEGSYR